MQASQSGPGVNLWSSPEHSKDYLKRADSIPHRREGEATLLEFLPERVSRFLDLGSGGGRLLALVKAARPNAEAVAVDFSEAMLEVLRDAYRNDAKTSIVEHDLSSPLPEIGKFDAVVSSFAIHHCTHERKQSLYEEIFAALTPGGVFCNLEHVASSSTEMHARFLQNMGWTPASEDPSNKLLDIETQLGWLRALGFADVDCYWKWLELALLVGFKLAQ
jgi:tRNA (cmo5U34)-methyltransferase